MGKVQYLDMSWLTPLLILDVMKEMAENQVDIVVALAQLILAVDPSRR